MSLAFHISNRHPGCLSRFAVSAEGEHFCITHMPLFVWHCVCSPAGAWPLDMHMFLCQSILAYETISFGVCFGYESMFFSLFCLSMHLFVSGYTGPWLCVCASCCTSVWPMCPHAWAQLDFVSCHMYLLGFSPQSTLC